MNKHTPGPWTEPHFATAAAGDCRCGYVFDGGEYTICEVYYHDKDDQYNQHPPLEEAKANARLIAAAPEMLFALNMAYTALAGHDETEADKIVRAAIAKAEGEPDRDAGKE